MPETFILGPCPAEEDTAQLGRTPDFDRLNRLEVDCYQAALIARYGPPPAGAGFARHSSTHDLADMSNSRCASSPLTRRPVPTLAKSTKGLAAGFTPASPRRSNIPTAPRR